MIIGGSSEPYPKGSDYIYPPPITEVLDTVNDPIPSIGMNRVEAYTERSLLRHFLEEAFSDDKKCKESFGFTREELLDRVVFVKVGSPEFMNMLAYGDEWNIQPGDMLIEISNYESDMKIELISSKNGYTHGVITIHCDRDGNFYSHGIIEYTTNFKKFEYPGTSSWDPRPNVNMAWIPAEGNEKA